MDDGSRSLQQGGNRSNATIGGRGAGSATVVLGGQTDGWLGLAPDAIEGVRNPGLALAAGAQYRVVWVNLDGRRHQFVLADASGAVVAETQPGERTGVTRSVRFEATRNLATYRCRFHPQRMRGRVTAAGPAGNRTDGNRTGPKATDDNATGNRTGDDATGNRTAGAGEAVEVAVGPEGQYFRFVPAEVEIPVGGTVRWTAESAGHNVSGRPAASRAVELPEGAEPFSSYPEGESFRVLDVGATYEHTFGVPGEYVYVCVPHVSEGMVGTVRVVE
jgi:plastocyanin